MKDALGHGSSAHGAGIEAAVPSKMSAERFQQFVAQSKANSARADQITDEVRSNGSASFEHPSGRLMVVSPSFEGSGGLRATSFDKDGEAWGHREYPAHDVQGLRSEISMALGGGFKYRGRA